jgi:MSHA biogenesis protein MshQ
MKTAFNCLFRVVFSALVLFATAAHGAECTAVFSDTTGVNENLPGGNRLTFDTDDWSSPVNWPASDTELTSDDYYYNDDDRPKDYVLTIASGATVRIFVNGDLKIDKDSLINSGGSADQLILFVDGDVDIKKATSFTGLLYATGKIDVKKEAVIEGVLASEDEIKLFNKADFSHDPGAVNPGLLDGLCETPGAVTLPDHIRLTHPGSGLTCSPADITVAACANEDCSTLFSDPVTVDFISPTANWSQDRVTFTETTEVSLQYTTPESVTLDAEASSPTRCFNGESETCEMTFRDSGFVIDVEPHVAGMQVNGTVAAVRKADGDDPARCVPGFSGESKDVFFWSQYSNPSTGTLVVSIDSTSINDASPGTLKTLSFDSEGVAKIDLRYPDVGQMRINARHEGSGDSEDLMMTGNGSFIARPAYFTLNIPDNPKADEVADGNDFVAAGEDFPITVLSRNASDEITPNFGQESAPEDVSLTASLVAPGGGRLPPLSGNFGDFAQDCDNNPAQGGTACGNFNWPEVGIIGITPTLASGAYLDSGNVTGNAEPNVGRFVPSHFSAELDYEGVIGTTCGGVDGFTYSDQDGHWSVEPTIKIVPKNENGDEVLNYRYGNFMRFKPEHITLLEDVPENDNSVTLKGSTLLYPVTFQSDIGTIRARDDGEDIIYQFSSDDVIRYTKSPDALIEPFGPELTFKIKNIRDSDIAPDDLDPPFSIDPNTDGDIYYGRLVIENVYGPETTGTVLTMPFAVEFFKDGSFKRNTLDDGSECSEWDADNIEAIDSSVTTPQLPHYVMNTIATGNFSEGRAELELGAKGTQATDTLEWDLSTKKWLQHYWGREPEDTGDPKADKLQNPRATATFGVYRGNDRIIYWREVFNN